MLLYEFLEPFFALFYVYINYQNISNLEVYELLERSNYENDYRNNLLWKQVTTRLDFSLQTSEDSTGQKSQGPFKPLKCPNVLGPTRSPAPPWQIVHNIHHYSSEQQFSE